MFNRVQEGDSCVDAYYAVGYEGSVAEKFDPLSSELSVDKICEELEDMAALLRSVGDNTAIDKLRFSYEVSFTEDVKAQQFNAYSSCVELNARDQPQIVCEDIMDRVESEFVLFSAG